MQFDPREYLSLREAAERLDVTPETLSRWIRSGRFPATRTLSGHYRIHPGDLVLAFEPVDAMAEEAAR